MTEAEIIARLEKATGPDRELDYDIGRVIVADDWVDSVDDSGGTIQFNRSHYHQQLIGDSRPTVSIDAAVALVGKVLPGWDWGRQDGYMFVSDGDGFAEAKNVSPAIALLIALFKARALAQGE